MVGKLTMGESIVEIRTQLRDHVESESKVHERMLEDLREIKESVGSFEKRFSGKWVEKAIITIYIAATVYAVQFIITTI